MTILHVIECIARPAASELFSTHAQALRLLRFYRIFALMKSLVVSGGVSGSEMTPLWPAAMLLKGNPLQIVLALLL